MNSQSGKLNTLGRHSGTRGFGIGRYTGTSRLRMSTEDRTKHVAMQRRGLQLDASKALSLTTASLRRRLCFLDCVTAHFKLSRVRWNYFVLKNIAENGWISACHSSNRITIMLSEHQVLGRCHNDYIMNPRVMSSLVIPYYLNEPQPIIFLYLLLLWKFISSSKLVR